jgi:hypothetical protein
MQHDYTRTIVWVVLPCRKNASWVQRTDASSQGMQLGLVRSGAQAVGVVTDECICTRPDA